MSYEDIIETIKNSQDEGSKCYFYIRLLRHYIYETDLPPDKPNGFRLVSITK